MNKYKYTVNMQRRSFDGNFSSTYESEHPNWIAEEIAQMLYGSVQDLDWPLCIKIMDAWDKPLGIFSISALRAPIFHAVKLYEDTMI